MGDTPLDITHNLPFDSSSAPKMATNKVRIYALTGAVAAITATGAWYGAGLNMRQELKEVCHLSPSQSIMYTYLPTYLLTTCVCLQEKAKTHGATHEEKIAQLQSMRQHLVRSKEELQAKIDKLSGKNVPPGSTTTVGMQGTLEGRTRTS